MERSRGFLMRSTVAAAAVAAAAVAAGAVLAPRTPDLPTSP
jgi:hypothetical protein